MAAVFTTLAGGGAAGPATTVAPAAGIQPTVFSPGFPVYRDKNGTTSYKEKHVFIANQLGDNMLVFSVVLIAMCIFMALLIGLTRWCDNRSGKRRDDHMITDALRWSEKGGSGASTGSGAGSAPRPGQSRSTSKTGRYADPTRLLSDDGHGPPGWDQREYALDPINRRNQPAYTNGNVNGNGGNMPYRREPLPRVNVSTTSPPARQRALHQQQPYLAPRGLAQQPPGYPAFSSVAPGASQLRHPQQTY